MRRILLALALIVLRAAPASANPVLMISIDGLRPLDIIDAPDRGLKVPNMRGFLTDGAYATGVRNMLPTVTYPNHTTLITGVAPAVHGIANNTKFDPLNQSLGWYWYSKDIQAPTLWDAVHAKHQTVASIGWPVSVGSPSIDFNIPEFWRARDASDLPLLEGVSTPGLIQVLEKGSGQTLAATFGSTADSDAARAKFAAALIAAEHPQFMTLHLVSFDSAQHQFGPDSVEAQADLEKIDTAVGDLIASARQAEPDLVVAIVSDHGFAPVSEETNLKVAFVKAGLIKLDPATGKIVSWLAMPWNAGGSVAVVLARPADKNLQKKVGVFLAGLVADPHSGVARMIDQKGIADIGGTAQASYFLDLKLGMMTGDKLTGPMVDPAPINGTHGYFPFHPEMRATFMIEGPGVPKADSLGDIDMRAIAPTLAKVLGVDLPAAKEAPLF